MMHHTMTQRTVQLLPQRQGRISQILQRVRIHLYAHSSTGLELIKQRGRAIHVVCCNCMRVLVLARGVRPGS